MVILGLGGGVQVEGGGAVEPRAQSEVTEASGREIAAKHRAGSYERGADMLTLLVEISPL